MIDCWNVSEQLFSYICDGTTFLTCKRMVFGCVHLGCHSENEYIMFMVKQLGFSTVRKRPVFNCAVQVAVFDFT
jgi:hypothetical protein